MIKVESSHLAGLEWHEEDHTLLVEFNNGSVYLYEEVPESYYKAVLAADSKGQAFNKFIKGKFKCEKVSDVSIDDLEPGRRG